MKRDTDNKIKATVTEDSDSTEFTNTCKAPTKATATIKMQKVLEGRPWNENDRFTFTLLADNTKNEKGIESPLPEETSVVVTDTKQDGSFGEITYDQAGVYHYTISERNDNEPGISYADPQPVTVTVTNQNGKLKTAVDADGHGSDKAIFINKYNASGSAILKITKKLDGGTLKAGEFTFTLSDAQDNTLQSVKNDAVGLVTFEKIPYTLSDLQGVKEKDGKREKTFEYKIREALPDGVNAQYPSKDGIMYDTTVIPVKVTVTDNGSGILYTQIHCGEDDKVPTLTNKVLKTHIIVKKVWEDNDNKDQKRPQKILIHLMKNGEKCADAKLSAENNWTQQWNDLTYDNGQDIYTIEEEKVDGYDGKSAAMRETTVDGDLITITLTNTQNKPSNPDNPSKPAESTAPVETTTTTAAETTAPVETPTTAVETTAPETSPVETTTSSHHEHHDHDDKPTPGPTTTAPDTTTAVETTTVAETTTEAGTTAPGHEHSEDITGPDGEVLGADRDRAHQTDTSQDGDVLGENRSKVAGANRQVKTGDISMMRLYAVGALVAIALLIGWVIRWKKKQR